MCFNIEYSSHTVICKDSTDYLRLNIDLEPRTPITTPDYDYQ